MVPAGYMFKRIARRPDWLKTPSVTDIWSISNCISKDFADYVRFWEHNGYWLFDSPEKMAAIAAREEINVADATLCYYEIHEEEFDENRKSWSFVGPEPSFKTDVSPPANRTLIGYDIATFYARSSAECSPLSCNSLAQYLPVNEHCLFATFDEAKVAIETGALNFSEPGPFRIFAVYSVERTGG